VTTYDLLRRGVTVADRRRVVVLADAYADALVLACQLASVDGVVPTDAWYRF